jgi:hypothetical protein
VCEGASERGSAQGVMLSVRHGELGWRDLACVLCVMFWPWLSTDCVAIIAAAVAKGPSMQAFGYNGDLAMPFERD